MTDIQNRITALQLRNFRKKILPADHNGCEIWIGALGLYGSGACGINVQGYGRVQLAHRLSYMLAYNTEIPRDQNIIHVCGNSLCQTAGHLKMVSKAESTSELAPTRRRTLITPAERALIKTLRGQGLSFPDIVRITGISYKTVWGTVHDRVGHKPRGRKPGGKNRRKPNEHIRIDKHT